MIGWLSPGMDEAHHLAEMGDGVNRLAEADG
jgi:hypothetical protein